jgi:hypothetical protein
MSYTVTIDRKASKFLRDISDVRLASRLRIAIDELSENPRHPGSIKLQGPDDLERFLFNLTHALSRREALHAISSLAGIDLIPALRSKRRASPRGASISLRQIK